MRYRFAQFLLCSTVFLLASSPKLLAKHIKKHSTHTVPSTTHTVPSTTQTVTPDLSATAQPTTTTAQPTTTNWTVDSPAQPTSPSAAATPTPTTTDPTAALSPTPSPSPSLTPTSDQSSAPISPAPAPPSLAPSPVTTASSDSPTFQQSDFDAAIAFDFQGENGKLQSSPALPSVGYPCGVPSSYTWKYGTKGVTDVGNAVAGRGPQLAGASYDQVYNACGTRPLDAECSDRVREHGGGILLCQLKSMDSYSETACRRCCFCRGFC